MTDDPVAVAALIDRTARSGNGPHALDDVGSGRRVIPSSSAGHSTRKASAGRMRVAACAGPAASALAIAIATAATANTASSAAGGT